MRVWNVYKDCPRFENVEYLIRYVESEDSEDLLKVYSDLKSVEFFNSDNCGGDNFYYRTEQKMKEVIGYWHWEYEREGFVRWAVVDKSSNEAVGTIEIFNRKANDYFTNCGLLRLDLRSDYEKAECIINILSLIIDSVYGMFGCDKIATKAIGKAKERIEALKKLGFSLCDENLIGHNGELFSEYYIKIK